MKKSNSLLIASIIILLGVVVIPVETSADSNENSVSMSSINEKLNLVKITTSMNIPEDNKLPWGTVKGAASDHVERYPIIIQFYKGDEPVHFAQVDVEEDGSYEYKFRVRNVDNNTGEITKIFEGQYTVKIFKVVNNQEKII
ncbi:MAG: hypothetical protein MAG458_01157 [Nitrosopumilus sp.]|nr:hypothetical protein [Nitrosopumilus sp.]